MMERALRKLLKGGRFENVPEGHSLRMKAIREKGNKSTETRLRGMLVRAGLRGWRVHPKGLTGKPDFLFPVARVVVFVDGCFWHACPRCGHVPNVNKPYWKAKIERNRQRDLLNTQRLREEGYRVLRLWEHDLQEAPGACIQRLTALLED